MKTQKFFFLVLLTLILISCEYKENSPSINGVKIEGYGWTLKQAFRNKGFVVVRTEKNAFAMKSNRESQDLSIITVMTGRNNKVLAATQTLMGYNLDEQFAELENEYNAYYGKPYLYNDSDTLKIRSWVKIDEDKIVAEVKLEGKISLKESTMTTPSYEIISPITGTPMTIGGTTRSFFITNMTQVKLSALNHQNIKKYAKNHNKKVL